MYLNTLRLKLIFIEKIIYKIDLLMHLSYYEFNKRYENI